MTFSEQELIAIVEEHLSSKTTKQVTTTKVAQKPTEGQWFEVKPLSIDQGLFEKKRKDTEQEATRQLIREAFAEMRRNPEKYGKNFKTMIPKKDWSYKTVAYLKAKACELGDHNADWVEQAFEWAQRIANGESWKTICNDPDTANWYRLVVWKNGYARFIGGSLNVVKSNSASSVHVHDGYFDDDFSINVIVPLAVAYDEEQSAA